MAVLTAAARKKLAPSQFALPGGAYPIPDEAHARAALSRAEQFATPQEKATIQSAVKRRFPKIHQQHMADKKMNSQMNQMIRGR